MVLPSGERETFIPQFPTLQRWEPGHEIFSPTTRVEQCGAVGVRDRSLNGKDESRSEKGVNRAGAKGAFPTPT